MFVRLLIFLGLLLLSSNTLATCTAGSASYNLSLSNITVDAMTTSGEILGSASVVKSVSCTSSGEAITYRASEISGSSSGMVVTVDGISCSVLDQGTELSELGLGLVWVNYNANTGSWACMTNQFYSDSLTQRGLASGTTLLTDKLYLVRTNVNLNPGSASLSGVFYGTVNSGPYSIFDLIIQVINISVDEPACTFSDYPSEVSLGSAYSQQFRNPGDTQNETDFSISLTCNSGTLSPAITFEGTTDSNYPTVFSNASGNGFAENVGVQLLVNDSVITPGSAVSLGQATTSVNLYDFSARLFRTGNAVTAGSIDIPVLFTVSYE